MKKATLFTILIAVATAVFLSCATEKVAGGTGSEDVNCRIVIAAYFPDSTPAAHAIVRLRPADFLADAGDNSLPKIRSRAGDYQASAGGLIEIDSIDTGSYCIEIYDSTYSEGPVGALVRIRFDSSDSTAIFPQAMLARCASLAGYVDRSIVTRAVNVSIRLRGLQRLTRALPDGSYVLENVPADDTLRINYAVETNEYLFVEKPIAVVPGTIHNLGTVMPGSSFSADLLAVRAILDSNGLYAVPADSVVLEINSRVDSLCLDNLGMTVIPADIGALSFLRVLSANGNALATLPDALAQCGRLKAIYCSLNAFSDLPPAIFALDSLEYIAFGQNGMITVPGEIGQCRRLREIYLHQNSIVTLPSQIFDLPYLDKISVAANSIDTLPSNIGACTTLTKLSIADNELADLPSSLCNLIKLREFFVEKNQLDSLPACIGSFSQLISFDISNNNLTALPDSIMSIPYLSHLRVDSNRICGVDTIIRAWLDFKEPGWDTSQVCP